MKFQDREESEFWMRVYEAAVRQGDGMAPWQRADAALVALRERMPAKATRAGARRGEVR